jgi:hypothetical protein
MCFSRFEVINAVNICHPSSWILHDAVWQAGADISKEIAVFNRGEYNDQ